MYLILCNPSDRCLHIYIDTMYIIKLTGKYKINHNRPITNVNQNKLQM